MVPKTLIVPVDDSDRSAHALACAEELARRFDCELLVMSADVDDGERTRPYVERLAAGVTNVPVRTECVTGDPAGAIIRLAQDMPDAVVCMATHSRGRLAAPLLGSVATDVLRGNDAPMVLVGPHWSPDWWHDPARMVVCWSDGASDPILAPAQQWSSALAMELNLLCVFHPLDVPSSVDPRGQFAEALAQLEPEHAGAETVALRDEFPAAAIAEYASARPATMLALTTRARSGVSRAALGSLAADVVHRSPCPVLVVRGR